MTPPDGKAEGLPEAAGGAAGAAAGQQTSIKAVRAWGKKARMEVDHLFMVLNIQGNPQTKPPCRLQNDLNEMVASLHGNILNYLIISKLK
jgi:hypothetical protein